MMVEQVTYTATYTLIHPPTVHLTGLHTDLKGTFHQPQLHVEYVFLDAKVFQIRLLLG